MFKKLTLLAAAGAGYVLGAKAGKERYAQIESKFREIAGMPAVQNATASVKETASGVAEQAKATANDTIEAVSDKAKSKGDQGGSTSSGAKAGAPMAGAAASGSAPDTPRS